MYALVEHFLNSKGKKLFPLWLSDIRIDLEKFEGFISVEHLKDIKEDNKIVILLKFDSFENLKTWANSKDHEQFIAKLKPYMEKEYSSTLLQLVG